MNIKNKVLICLLVLGLTACSSSISGWQILSMQKYCETHNGIDHFIIVLGVGVICRDGAYFEPKSF